VTDLERVATPTGPTTGPATGSGGSTAAPATASVAAVRAPTSDPAAGSSAGAMPVRRTTAIQALDRSAALLDALAAAGPQGRTLKQLTDAVGLRASTGRTLLSSLVAHGFAAQDPGTRRYLLGSRVFELNRRYLAQADLSAVAAPVLRAVWERTRETVHLAVLQGTRRVDVAVLVSPQLLNINPTSTQLADEATVPLHHTAAGKVLLAGLPPPARADLLARAPWHRGVPDAETTALLAAMDEVRDQGYATNLEEDAPGVCGVAAPVLDHDARTVAALCIGYPSTRHRPAVADELRDVVVAAAGRLSRLLGADVATATSDASAGNARATAGEGEPEEAADAD